MEIKMGGPPCLPAARRTRPPSLADQVDRRRRRIAASRAHRRRGSLSTTTELLRAHASISRGGMAHT